MVTPVPGELYLAYLPLAHVLELLSENCMMLFGIKVSFLFCIFMLLMEVML